MASAKSGLLQIIFFISSFGITCNGQSLSIFHACITSNSSIILVFISSSGHAIDKSAFFICLASKKKHWLLKFLYVLFKTSFSCSVASLLSIGLLAHWNISQPNHESPQPNQDPS